MCERLQGSGTHRCLPLAKDALLSQAWGLLGGLISSSPWGLSALSWLFAITLFPFHPLPTRLVVSFLYSNEISFHLHPSLKTNQSPLCKDPLNFCVT